MRATVAPAPPFSPREPSRVTGGVPALVRELLRTLGRVELTWTAAYVLLSLAAAFAGSLVALLLVPLVRPEHTVLPGVGLVGAQHGVLMQAGLFAAAMAAFALLRWQAARLGARLVGRYGATLRRQVHARLIGAPLAALADATSAEIANVLTYNVEIVVQGFSALQQLLVAGLTATVSLGFAFWVSPPLMLVAPLCGWLGLIASRAYGREQSRVSRQYVADMTRLFWHSEDFPRRLRHIRSFGKEQSEQASYGAISDQLCQGYRRQLELVASGRLMLELLAALVLAGLFVLAHQWRGIEPASLIAVCLLLGRLLPYLISTRQSFQQLRTAAPAFELWQRYMGLDRDPSGPSGEAAAGGPLHIEQLRLRPPTCLEVEALALVPGQLTLVCGDSGIGKSSLADVLAGMMAPQRFVARRGNQKLTFEAYRQLVRNGAYVSQHARPWQHSIGACLRWVVPDATDDVLLGALAEVGMGRWLAASDRGLDTPLYGTSSGLSGGELQRLMLAQVLLRQPLLAVLDEATGALDAAAEIELISTIKRRLPHTILIVISHRAGVAALADQFLRIGSDRGAITAQTARRHRAG